MASNRVASIFTSAWYAVCARSAGRSPVLLKTRLLSADEQSGLFEPPLPGRDEHYRGQKAVLSLTGKPWRSQTGHLAAGRRLDIAPRPEPPRYPVAQQR